MKDDKCIYHELKSCISSSGESAELILIVDTVTEEVSVKLKKSYAKYYKLSELQEAKDTFETLTGSGFVIDIDRLKQMVHTKPTPTPTKEDE